MDITVAPGDLLPDLIAQLRTHTGETVTVRIGSDSSLLLTANEFRALSIAAERADIPLIVETDDELRRQLATLFGIPVLWPEDSEGELERAAFDPSIPSTSAFTAQDPDIAVADLDDEPASLPETVEPAQQSTSPTSSRSWLKTLGVVAAALVLVTVGIGVWWWFTGSATVTITAETQTVSSNLNFVVVEPGAPAPATNGVTVQGEPVSFDLQVSLDAPATGEVSVGETPAIGELVLRNPSGEPVELAAGQRFESLQGIEYVLSETAVVPAGTPESTPGEVTVAIEAAEPGSGGNLDVGLLSGRLDNGVYFSNRTAPLSGGTDRTTLVVSEEDLAALQASADETLRSLASTSELSGGLRVVPSTLTMSDATYTFNQEAGTETESVAVTASATFTAVAFPSGALDDGAAALLATQVPAGYELDPVSITFEVPAETAAADGSRALVIPVSGEVSPVFGETEAAAIANEVSGMTDDEARNAIETMPGIESVQITYDPDWFLHRMPNDPDRIDVEKTS